MEIKVRKASPDDYISVCALYEEIDTYHRDALPQLFQKFNGPARPLDSYLGLLADEQTGLFVAQDQDEIIGLVQGSIKESNPFPIFIPKRYAVVENIIVKANMRHHNIGNLLMEERNNFV